MREAFVRSWGAAVDAPVEALDAAVRRCLEAASDAFPALPNDAARFGEALARGRREGRSALRWLEEARASDLWLALACESGNPAALAEFQRAMVAEVRRAAERSQRAPLDPEDLAQLVWQKLFVGEAGAQPKIREYAGEGDLRGWVRVVAVRSLVDVARKRSGGEAPVSGERAADLLFAPGADPELEYLKRHYRAEFAAAFTDAIAALEPEDRTSLRQHFVDQLSIDQIAHAQGIHRATAARRVQKAREGLLSDTRRRLMAKLQLSRGELESVMRMIESQLHVSVGRLLK
ncbi:MAG: sigma-70 family RNA polymerase sigma factor [Myxococcales bacterium]|nr:sigma-70 family RNA polymerase sigma factor [Myxococcales bacterium]